MDALDVNQLVADLLIILTAGFISGAICRRAGMSLLVGYLIIGAVIGEGGFGIVAQSSHELEYLARAGALLLLFSVGIEFSMEELIRLRRYMFVGGAVQMLLVAVPLTVVMLLFGMDWKPALLVGAAGALSSTILVFKALAEWGHTATARGRRAIAILLFQDVAFVPLMLLVPLLTGVGDRPTVAAFVWLLAKSLAFVCGVVILRRAIARWLMPLLSNLRSVELVVLFTLTALGGGCWLTHSIGLPPALGALASGLMLSGNRLSKQIDTLILPYRESFAAVFFVTLGTLLRPSAFLEEPLLLAAGLLGMIALKSVAASVALRLTGMSSAAAFGMGIGLAQMGEFSFVLIAEGVGQNVISPDVYSRILFIAMGTLILTPQLIKFGLRWAGAEATGPREKAGMQHVGKAPIQKAVLIGIGPIARQVASRLETLGIDVCLIDFSPINLHPFGQQGFHTVAGDARESEVLHRAGASQCCLAVVCVPDDEAACQIVRALRARNGAAYILVRCRYLASLAPAKAAGANSAVSEEQVASTAILQVCEEVVKNSSELNP